MAGKRLIVTLSDEGRKAFSATAKEVSRSGLKVKEKMPELGLIVGEAASDSREKITQVLNGIQGVSSVEEEGTAEAI